MTTQPIHLAVALDGVGWHPGAWRDDPENAQRLTDPRYWVELAAEAERAGLDFLTLEDTLALQTEAYGAPVPRTDRVRGRLDAVLIASRIAPTTRHIGLVPTVVTTHTEPFHVAKAIATLDYVSTGRAGIRLKVGASRSEARLFGRRVFPEFTPANLDDPLVAAAVGGAFDEAGDVAEVLRRLWDSWEDDAEIRDKPTGRFIDRDKLHYIDFEGRWFSVKGPLTVPRPPQGQPIVSVLGHGTGPYALGVATSDVIYVTPRDASHAREIVTEIRGIENDTQRAGEPSKVFGDVVVVLEDDADRAHRRRERLDELAGGSFSSDALIFAGTATELADLVEAWTQEGLAGIRLRPAAHRTDLAHITQQLVPELVRRGLRRDGYVGTTFRQTLGLDRPLSRYATTSSRETA